MTPENDAATYRGGLVEPLLKKMSAFPAPTFAAAHGACLSVGLRLLLATDTVYVAENAKFGSPFATLGATLDSDEHWYFTVRLGMHHAEPDLQRRTDQRYGGGGAGAVQPGDASG